LTSISRKVVVAGRRE